MTLTKEWLLKTIAELEEERDATPGAVNEDAAMALVAMKLAMASLEAEPVFEVEVSGNHWLNAGPVDDSDFSGMPDGVNQLYSAPPVPVSVPLAIHDEDFEKALSVLNDTLDDCGDSERGLLLALDKVGIAVRSDACHAAMLQGVEPVSNRDELPDGWVACSERMPNIGVPVITCCGDVVQYAAYAWDGKEWQDWYEEYDKLPANAFTHWHPRPAAPQQEVK